MWFGYTKSNVSFTKWHNKLVEKLTLTDVSERFALIKWIDGNPLIDGSKSFETKDKCMEYWESLPKMKDIIYTVCRIKNAR